MEDGDSAKVSLKEPDGCLEDIYKLLCLARPGFGMAVAEDEEDGLTPDVVVGVIDPFMEGLSFEFFEKNRLPN